MPAVKFDVSGVETATFVQPQPGFYQARVVAGPPSKPTIIAPSRAGNEMLTLVLQITEGEYEDSLLWHYVLLDGSADWKLKETLIALGLVTEGKKEKGELDSDKIIGTKLGVRVEAGSYNNEYQARVKSLHPTETPDEEEDLSESSSTNDDDDYDSWTIGELREELKNRELSADGKKKSILVDRLKTDDEEDVI